MIIANNFDTLKRVDLTSMDFSDWGINYDLNLILKRSCELGNVEVVNQLLSSQLSLDVNKIVDGRSLFSISLSGGHDAIAMKLINSPNFNIELSNAEGTPLYNAYRRDKEELVAALLEKGASVKAMSPGGNVLTFACDTVNQKMIALILEKASLDLEDFHPSSKLANTVKKCEPEVQALFNKQALKKNLEEYINTREKEGEYINKIGLGYSKTEKITAAKALLSNINGEDNHDLKSHEKVLSQGRLSKLYASYNNSLPQTSSEITHSFRSILKAGREGIQTKSGDLQTNLTKESDDHFKYR